jgi:hypothetical protein
VRKPLPGAGQITVFKQVSHGVPLRRETAATEDGPGRERGDGESRERVMSGRRLERRAGTGGRADAQCRVHDAPAPRISPHPLLECTGDPAEERDGMPTPGVTEDDVGSVTCDKSESGN